MSAPLGKAQWQSEFQQCNLADEDLNAVVSYLIDEGFNGPGDIILANFSAVLKDRLKLKDGPISRIQKKFIGVLAAFVVSL